MKALFVRDSRTHYGVLALRLDEPDAPEVMKRGGFGSPADYLVLIHLAPEMRAEWSPYEWGDATLRAAHLHLSSGGYEAIRNGGTLDVERLRLSMVEAADA